jgi:NAD-reducing hydrogenase large subunit
MSKKIILQKATRIEGNADVHLEIEGGKVQAARFMVQDFRGFEKFIQGKRADSAPQIVSRICGLCSCAHQVAGMQAVEDALGIVANPSVKKWREIAFMGEWIASHALSFFFLTFPDSAHASRGIFDLLHSHPDIAGDAFLLRRSGNRIVEIVGKRAVHAVAMSLGGFRGAYTQADVDEIRTLAAEVKDVSKKLLDRLGAQWQKEAPLTFPAEQNFSFLAYDEQTASFKAFDRAGRMTDEFSRENFGEHISEMRVDWSLAKFPYLTQRGFPDGILLVGPLSRLFRSGNVRADPELAGLELIRPLNDPAALHLDHLDLCRLLEIFWAAKRILYYADEVDLSQLAAPVVDLEKSGQGVGVVEAPRGTLVHEYQINRGIVERMRLLVATQFNNAYINLVLRDVAERHVNGDGLTEAGEALLARCVRTFDPCLTCATH